MRLLPIFLAYSAADFLGSYDGVVMTVSLQGC